MLLKSDTYSLYICIWRNCFCKLCGLPVGWHYGLKHFSYFPSAKLNLYTCILVSYKGLHQDLSSFRLCSVLLTRSQNHVTDQLTLHSTARYSRWSPAMTQHPAASGSRKGSQALKAPVWCFDSKNIPSQLPLLY